MSEYYKILEGITINAIGDSYLEGDKLERQYTWPRLIAEKYGLTFNNFGKNGSTMSNFVDTNKPMVVRYIDMPQNEPDIVMIEGGRNDYNKSVPIGEDGSLDTKTFKGAARFLITELKERYPSAKFIAMTCWEVGGKENSAGNMCSDYGRAFLSVCEDMARKYDIKFYYKDFRFGFREGQNMARELELYMQKYCGCIYSEEDRYRKQIERDKCFSFDGRTN